MSLALGQVNHGLSAMAVTGRALSTCVPLFFTTAWFGEEFVVGRSHLSGKSYLLWKQEIESEVYRWIACQERKR